MGWQIMKSSIKDFKTGGFVQSTPNHSPSFVGHIVGITVNPIGEPILSLNMTVRKFLSDEDMRELGFVPVDDTVKKFWQRTGGMHVTNVEPLDQSKNL